MKTKRLFCVATVVLVVVIVFAAFASAQGTTLTAAKVDVGPTVDGDASDAAWASATALDLSSPSITMKAVYDGQYLYVLATVPDTTASFTRGGAWVWDGSAWGHPEGQSEDRLAIMWSMDTPNFDTQGCMTKCHPGTNAEGGEDDAWLETGKADMWHMKAARSLPATSIAQAGSLTVDEASHEVTGGSVTMHGWTDDKWVGQWSGDNAPDGGRYGDEGQGNYSHNRNDDKSAPVYMETAPADYADAMTLYQSEIDGGEAVEVASADVAALWANYAALKAAVPERILRPAEGSRGDVEQAATWSDGTWTLEFKRALDTGHPDDDVIFDDLSQTYPFGVAWMDNTDGAEHVISGLLGLTFAAGAAATLPTTGGITPEMLAPFALVAFGLLSLTGGVAGYAWRRRNGNEPEAE